MLKQIKAYISEIRGNRAGNLSEKVSISANYECASIISSITFDVSIDEAKKYHIGQELIIEISLKE